MTIKTTRKKLIIYSVLALLLLSNPSLNRFKEYAGIRSVYDPIPKRKYVAFRVFVALLFL